MRRLSLIAVILLCVLCISVFGFDRTPDITLLWNMFTELKVIDNYVVGLSEQGIAVFALDDDNKLLIESNHLVLPSMTKTMKLQGDLLIVRLANDELTFIDIAQLPEIELLGKVISPINYSDFELVDDSLYLSRWFDGIDKYELQGYSEMQLIENIKPGVLITQLDHDYQYLYGLDRYNGVVRMPISSNVVDSVGVMYIPERPYYFNKSYRLFVTSKNTDGIFLSRFDDGYGQVLTPVSGFPSPLRAFEYKSKFFLISARQIDVLDGPSISIQRTIAIDSQITGGDTLTIDNQIHLLLPNSESGITAFNMITDEEPIQLVSHSGPVSAAVAYNDALFTGGTNNPLEIYRLENDSLVDAVALNGTDLGIQDLEISENYLYSLNAKTHSVKSFDISDINGIIDVVDSVESAIDDAQSIEFFHLPFTGENILLIAGRTEIEILTTESGMLTPVTVWHFDNAIANCAINNSRLYVADRFGAISAFDIVSDYTLSQCGERNLTGTSWAMLTNVDKTLVFTGNTVTYFENCLDVDTILHLPLPVLDAQIVNDTLYTIGSIGAAKYDISSGLPVFVTSGGLRGSMISVSNSLISSTDGNSINLYFRNSQSPQEEEELSNASKMILYNNFPEPFNSMTVIQYELTSSQKVNLTLYNVLGQKVVTLVDEIQPAGVNRLRWDGRDDSGRDVASGIYFYKLKAIDETVTRKMMLIR